MFSILSSIILVYTCAKNIRKSELVTWEIFTVLVDFDIEWPSTTDILNCNKKLSCR